MTSDPQQGIWFKDVRTWAEPEGSLAPKIVRGSGVVLADDPTFEFTHWVVRTSKCAATDGYGALYTGTGEGVIVLHDGRRVHFRGNQTFLFFGAAREAVVAADPD